MNILDTIVANKKKEVEQRKSQVTIKQLAGSLLYERTCFSITESLNKKGASGIIAEHKRKSPSKGIINDRLHVGEVVASYQNNGASAVSILTDQVYFGGSDEDVLLSREILTIPILRKEFIIDEYQLHEAKSIGADVILLIAACLQPKEVKHFSSVANALGLEVLLELHDEEEFDHLCEGIQLVGINNRSLKTFDVDIDRSLKMAEMLPREKIKVAESGMDHPSQIIRFKQHGYKGFLIGESFMKSSDPGKALASFLNPIQ